ncbi:hypothetical protein [Ectopseudomonas oleovorans]|uniref:hypothetical protein n=1 Tax=Ectopseudomonas oleovorans TaxID=301 RepID=UPI003F1CA772
MCLRKGIEWTAANEAEWVESTYAFYGDAADEELDCIPSQGGGAFLSLALLEQRSRAGVPVLRLDYPQGYEVIAEHLRLADSLGWCERELAPLLAQIPAGAWSFYGMTARSGDSSVITVWCSRPGWPRLRLSWSSCATCRSNSRSRSSSTW